MSMICYLGYGKGYVIIDLQHRGKTPSVDILAWP